MNPKIRIENIRSFDGLQEVEITPLTILLGENSAGKSTFLAAASAVLTGELLPSPKGLNEQPYDLGGFDTIATYRGGKAGRKKHFSLAATVPIYDVDLEKMVELTYWIRYKSNNGRPVAQEYCVQTEIGKAEVNLAVQPGRVKLSQLRGVADIEFEISKSWRADLTGGTGLAAEAIGFASKRGDPIDKLNITYLFRLLDISTPNAKGCSIAPIRTRPARTYDAATYEFGPDGNHIPYLLARLMLEDSESEKTKSVIKALHAFGKESGLFDKIKVYPLGGKAGSPFRLMVHLEGPPRNITDVGYGVSQSLPIITQLMNLSDERYVFVQQPEVHLHPRAQAALGSFLSSIAAGARYRNFIVETHSDFLVDRIRQEIASGNLKPEKAQILYFRLENKRTKIYPIRFDQSGNLVNPPAHYREFFMEERRRQLSRVGV